MYTYNGNINTIDNYTNVYIDYIIILDRHISHKMYRQKATYNVVVNYFLYKLF